MRIPFVAFLLSISTVASACPAGDAVTFTREEDGALFNPDRYGQTAEGIVFAGLFNDRTAYLLPSPPQSSTRIGTSGYQPPASRIRWQTSFEGLEDGQPIGNVDEGPLRGTWYVTCQATN
jgi:hypothetical protein